MLEISDCLLQRRSGESVWPFGGFLEPLISAASSAQVRPHCMFRPGRIIETLRSGSGSVTLIRVFKIAMGGLHQM
jgi:hypothetical protein